MKKALWIFLISAIFPVLNAYATDYNVGYLWSDHGRLVDGKKIYRMIAYFFLDTAAVNAYLELPDKALTYQLDYWGPHDLDPFWHEHGKSITSPPPGDWWKTTYQFRTDDGLTTPIYSHVSSNFEPLDFAQTKIVGLKHPNITWDSVAGADQYRVRLYDPSNGDLLFSETIEENGSSSYSYTYTGDLFSQNDFLWISLDVRDYESNQLIRRSRIDQEHSGNPAGEFIITLKLKDVPASLAFYQDHVPDNASEYEWGVYIDTDSNLSTGNNEGYDILISISNWSYPGNTPTTSSIMDGTQKDIWILSAGGASKARSIKAEIDYNMNTLAMIVREDYPELNDLDITDRFRFRTRYYSTGGPVEDETIENSAGSNSILDSINDVEFDFIDIIEGKIEYRYAVQDEFPWTIFYPAFIKKKGKQ